MRSTARQLAAITSAAALLACLAMPALAKEFLQATLDAPVAMDTPPGTAILVGVTVLVPGDDKAMHPVDGSPIQLILTGRDGARTRAAGAVDGRPGHYVMRIVIPEGGARGLEVVMHGTSDLPLMLTADPFTFGGVTARTAQVAPPLVPPMTPFPRPSAVSAAPVAAPAQQPVPAPAPAVPVPTPAGPAPLVVLGLAAVGVAVLVGTLARLRRSRAARRPPSAGRAPGA